MIFVTAYDRYALGRIRGAGHRLPAQAHQRHALRAGAWSACVVIGNSRNALSQREQLMKFSPALKAPGRWMGQPG